MPVRRTAATGFVGRTGDGGNVTAYAGTANYGNLTGVLRRMFNKGIGSRKAKATLLALTGAAVGGASKAYSSARISAGVSTGQVGINNLGGARTVETVNYQTGVTVAQDLTDFDTRLAASVRLPAYTMKGMSSQGNMAGKLV